LRHSGASLPAVATSYPADWETDVVLADGSTAHIRPITPDDADRLVAFYDRVSDESKYYRFFAPYPKLTERDVERFTHVDYVDRNALIVLRGDDMVAVGRYDKVTDRVAEVAFLVEDTQHGLGVGSVLLEHLAQVARERGFTHFVADVLPQNTRMIRVFKDAGYTVARSYDEGVVHLEFEITPTVDMLAVMEVRERVSEARSVARLLSPKSVAVVGASRTRETIGQTLVRNLVVAGFTGRVYAVNPYANAIAGVPAYPSLRDLPEDIDLALVVVPADSVANVVADAAEKNVKGLVVVSSGFSEAGDEGRAREQELAQLARGNGMRLIGPNCLGVINTAPEISLTAALPTVFPKPGPIGVFSQSGTIGTPMLNQVEGRQLGLSSFIAASSRADVSANDFLQYCASDPRTEVVLLYLESLGNPRKFSRIARYTARSKPIVAVKSGRRTAVKPVGRTTTGEYQAPPQAVEALFRQAGVIAVDTLPELFDVGQLLVSQPLPTGRRVAIVSNSDAVTLIAADAVANWDLELAHSPIKLGAGATGDEFRTAIEREIADPTVHAVLVVFAHRALQESSIESVTAVLNETLHETTKPVVLTLIGVRTSLDVQHLIRSYPSPEEAIRALGRVSAYAEWRSSPTGTIPTIECDDKSAHRLVEEWMAERPDGMELSPGRVSTLLACYGIDVVPVVPVDSLDAALAAAKQVGYDVVLKATAAELRHRPDLTHVWRNISNEEELRDAWDTMSASLANTAEAGFVVQRMVPSGVPVIIRAAEDALYGPVLSFGVAGVSTELFGDRAYRIPPLTDIEAVRMIREVRAAPLLFGYRGAPAADVAAIEQLLHRVARLTDDLSELAFLELDPVVVAPHGLAVLKATAQLAPSPSRSDWYTRRLA
jgi:acyl-CoA synthetase (NDP forming)/GNAT superfamily N-acetyltransferase